MNLKTFTVKSFGCKVNQYEEQVLIENMIKSGFQRTNAAEADIFIINSCTVTSQADKKALGLLRKVKRLNPNIKILFTGCLAVLPEDISALKLIKEIDQVVTNPDKFKIPLILGGKSPGNLMSVYQKGISCFDSRSRAFVSIQNGCDQACSYCKVSLVRGNPMSRDINSILDEVKLLLENGYKELVLTGICIGLWRGAKGEKLSDLLEKIIKIKNNFRIRISSIEPNHIDQDVIFLMSSTRKICNHLHIPLQSGSNKVLNHMNRRYTANFFYDLICDIRAKINSIGISLDVITGFPGETEKDFFDSIEFIKSVNPSRLHVFRYSDRKGTKSFTFKDKIPLRISKERVNSMILQGIQMQNQFHEKLIGRPLEVLVEGPGKKAFQEGYSSEYARVRLSGNHNKIGELIYFTPQKFDPCNMCLF